MGNFLFGLGLFFLALGALLASLYYPAARVVLLFVTAGVAAVLGLWILSLAVRWLLLMQRRIRALEEMADMTNVERHAFVARKWRRRRGTASRPTTP